MTTHLPLADFTCPLLYTGPCQSPRVLILLRFASATPMLELYDQIQQAKSFLQSRWKGQPTVGIILGTGLGGLTEDIRAEASIPYGDIPHFPKATAPSHKGQLVCGQLAGKSVVAM